MTDPESTHSEAPTCVTREELYALVWTEPMLKVATRFSVSSSYMARICGALNVPRPQRGYWAKLAVGQHPRRPKLPEAVIGSQTVWNRSGGSMPVQRPLPRPPTTKPRRRSKAASGSLPVHLLIQGAKGHFEVGHTSYDSQYLKPAKRSLVDLVVTKTVLDKALNFANTLFRELEAHDCRVVLAPKGEYLRRAAVDEHEVPQKPKTNTYYDYHRLWSPGRNTVTYIGTVAIGLTVIELSEVAEARYVKGEYVRVDAQTQPRQRSRYSTDDHWTTTKRDFPTGRLCLQAYCPDTRAEWTKQWRETKERDLTTKIPVIVRELFDAAPVVAGLIEAGEREAELRRQEWDEEKKQIERAQAEERAAKARNDSRVELLQIVNLWAEANRIEQFFRDAESGLAGLTPDEQAAMQDRLRQARKLLGPVNAFERFQGWKTPAERQS